MINILNRALLLADIKSVSIIEAEDKLKRYGIEYYEKKKIFTRTVTHLKLIQRSANLPVPKPKKKKMLYLLYVKRSDLKKAREVIDMSL